MLDRIVGVASLVPFVIGTLVAPHGPAAPVDFAFHDRRIVESSSLVVDADGLFVTANDSGDSGRVFVVDGSGRTVGVTSWADEPTDVESMAPAGPGSVWVGDTGDNTGSRSHIEVLRVPYSRGSHQVDPTTYSLVYPDGPHDAETLMANPTTGQLFVVSKGIFGGTVYAAPRTLSTSQPNRLRAVADAPPVATDGAFFPDGRHYVVRGYGDATVYTYPGREAVGTFTLPDQRQGEAIAVAPDGSVHVSTEGQFSDVLRVRLPRAVRTALSSPPVATLGSSVPPAASDEEPVWPWLLGGVGLLGFVAGIGWLLTRHGAAA